MENDLTQACSEFPMCYVRAVSRLTMTKYKRLYRCYIWILARGRKTEEPGA
jgi:hypothetical protein